MLPLLLLTVASGRMSRARSVSIVSYDLNLTVYMGAVAEPVTDMMRAG